MIANRFKAAEANKLMKEAGASAADKELALRVYTSRLIGSDPDLVMHGGGNTSVKLRRRDVFGDLVNVLHIKGSGWDLGTIEAPGLPAVRLDPLLRLRKLSKLSDEDMVDVQRCNLLSSTSPTPSVETLLHGFLPHAYVDHTHATAFLVLANLPDAPRVAAEIFGDRLAIVPYIMPGFALAKVAAQVYEANPHVEGLLLVNHGHFTFGSTARESYDRVIRHTNLALRWLKRRTRSAPSFSSVGTGKATPKAAQVLPELRGVIGAALAEHKNDRDASMPVFELRSASATKRILKRPDLAKLANLGVGTPDHVIRTKWHPLVLSPADCKKGRSAYARRVADFVSSYKEYFKRNAKRFKEGKTMLSPTPNVVLVPGIGVIGVGANAGAARIAADIAEQSLQIWSCGMACGKFATIREPEVFDMEYWSLEQAKLGKAVPPPMHGRVVMVTGGGGAIGLATAKAFAAAGCQIMLVDRDRKLLADALSQLRGAKSIALDVTAKGAAAKAMTASVEGFGGLDILVSNAGAAWTGEMIELDEADLRKSYELNFFAHRSFAVEAAKLFGRQGRGGQILVNVSKQAVNPGKGFGAYGLPKSSAMFLVKQLALELGGDGVRVNGLNPDRIRSGLLTPDFIASRAKARGVTIVDYMGNNLLRREVEAHHVGDAFVAMAMSERTTAHVLPVDGGNIEASLR